VVVKRGFLLLTLVGFTQKNTPQPPRSTLRAGRRLYKIMENADLNQTAPIMDSIERERLSKVGSYVNNYGGGHFQSRPSYLKPADPDDPLGGHPTRQLQSTYYPPGGVFPKSTPGGTDARTDGAATARGQESSELTTYLHTSIQSDAHSQENASLSTYNERQRIDASPGAEEAVYRSSCTFQIKSSIDLSSSPPCDARQVVLFGPYDASNTEEAPHATSGGHEDLHKIKKLYYVPSSDSQTGQPDASSIYDASGLTRRTVFTGQQDTSDTQNASQITRKGCDDPPPTYPPSSDSRTGQFDASSTSDASGLTRRTISTGQNNASGSQNASLATREGCDDPPPTYPPSRDSQTGQFDASSTYDASGDTKDTRRTPPASQYYAPGTQIGMSDDARTDVPAPEPTRPDDADRGKEATPTPKMFNESTTPPNPSDITLSPTKAGRNTGSYLSTPNSVHMDSDYDDKTPTRPPERNPPSDRESRPSRGRGRGRGQNRGRGRSRSASAARKELNASTAEDSEPDDASFKSVYNLRRRKPYTDTPRPPERNHTGSQSSLRGQISRRGGGTFNNINPSYLMPPPRPSSNVKRKHDFSSPKALKAKYGNSMDNTTDSSKRISHHEDKVAPIPSPISPRSSRASGGVSKETKPGKSNHGRDNPTQPAQKSISEGGSRHPPKTGGQPSEIGKENGLGAPTKVMGNPGGAKIHSSQAAGSSTGNKPTPQAGLFDNHEILDLSDDAIEELEAREREALKANQYILPPSSDANSTLKAGKQQQVKSIKYNAANGNPRARPSNQLNTVESETNRDHRARHNPPSSNAQQSSNLQPREANGNAAAGIPTHASGHNNEPKSKSNRTLWRAKTNKAKRDKPGDIIFYIDDPKQYGNVHELIKNIENFVAYYGGTMHSAITERRGQIRINCPPSSALILRKYHSFLGKSVSIRERRAYGAHEIVLTRVPSHWELEFMMHHIPCLSKLHRKKSGEGWSQDVFGWWNGGDPPPTLSFSSLGDIQVRPFYPNPDRCKNCHQYVHVTSECGRTETCGFCARNHPSRECWEKLRDPERAHEVIKKCANCKGPHTAYAISCPEYQHAKRRIIELVNAKSPLTNPAKRQDPSHPMWHPSEDTSTNGEAIRFIGSHAPPLDLDPEINANYLAGEPSSNAFSWAERALTEMRASANLNPSASAQTRDVQTNGKPPISQDDFPTLDTSNVPPSSRARLTTNQPKANDTRINHETTTVHNATDKTGEVKRDNDALSEYRNRLGAPPGYVIHSKTGQLISLKPPPPGMIRFPDYTDDEHEPDERGPSAETRDATTPKPQRIKSSRRKRRHTAPQQSEGHGSALYPTQPEEDKRRDRYEPRPNNPPPQKSIPTQIPGDIYTSFGSDADKNDARNTTRNNISQLSLTIASAVCNYLGAPPLTRRVITMIINQVCQAAMRESMEHEAPTDDSDYIPPSVSFVGLPRRGATPASTNIMAEKDRLMQAAKRNGNTELGPKTGVKRKADSPLNRSDDAESAPTLNAENKPPDIPQSRHAPTKPDPTNNEDAERDNVTENADKPEPMEESEHTVSATSPQTHASSQPAPTPGAPLTNLLGSDGEVETAPQTHASSQPTPTPGAPLTDLLGSGGDVQSGVQHGIMGSPPTPPINTPGLPLEQLLATHPNNSIGNSGTSETTKTVIARGVNASLSTSLIAFPSSLPGSSATNSKKSPIMEAMFSRYHAAPANDTPAMPRGRATSSPNVNEPPQVSFNDASLISDSPEVFLDEEEKLQKEASCSERTSPKDPTDTAHSTDETE